MNNLFTKILIILSGGHGFYVIFKSLEGYYLGVTRNESRGTKALYLLRFFMGIILVYLSIKISIELK